MDRSLRLLLLTRLLPALLFLLLMGVAAGNWVALRAATKAYDRGLLDTAFTIAEQLRVEDGKLVLPLSPQARDVLLTDKFDSIFYAVRSDDGTLLDGNRELPMPQPENFRRLGSEGRAYYDGNLGDLEIRLAAFQKQVGEQRVTILAAETMIKRNELVRDVLVGMLVPELLLIIVSVSVVWFGVRSGLQPLETLRAELANRSPEDLSPVTVAVPDEIRPLASEVNSLMRRLGEALDSQRTFVSNAAHQLRTPIAALQAQVEAAQYESAAGDTAKLAGIHAAAIRLGRLVEQLLALARAEPRLGEASHPVDLPEIVRDIAEAWLPRAIAKDIDLGFELSPAGIAGNETLLQELVSNLLDNALRHAPAHGTVTVSCGETGGLSWLVVEDSGPGIPEADRVRVGERFYRPAGQKGDGSGLGLAIVRQIASQHHGELRVGVSERLGGALLRVEFPAITTTTNVGKPS